MGRKKRYIDKKSSATYALMLRESRGGDDDVERVFVRIDNSEAFPEDSEALQSPSGKRGVSDVTRQQLLEMGFPDDGYNYLEHMRTIGGGDYVAAPRASFVTADVKAYDASRVLVEGESDLVHFPVLRTKVIRSARVIEKGLDPEVAAVLEEDVASEAETGSDLEDDFILVANKDVTGECSGFVDDEADELFDSPAEEEASDDEPAEVQSSEIVEDREPRVVDEQFELLALKEYDDASDDDEPDPRARGHADISQFGSIFSEFLTSHQTKYVAEPSVVDVKPLPLPPSDKKASEVPVKKTVYVYSSSEEELEVSDDEDRERWDCESILSTLSNLDNHPAKIAAPGRVRFSAVVQGDAVNGPQVIRLGGKQKLPVDFLPPKAAASKEDVRRETPTNLVRQRGVETPEERKARKASVKEAKRASRQAKKELKVKYKSEGHRAQVGAAVMGPKTIHLP